MDIDFAVLEFKNKMSSFGGQNIQYGNDINIVEYLHRMQMWPTSISKGILVESPH